MSLKFSLATVSAILLCLLVSTPAMAQQQNLRIQLPVVRQFNVRTAVSVPDGGTMILGGGSASSASRTSSGLSGLGRPFANRSSSYRNSRGQASVTTRVISNQEISEAILSGASPARPTQLPYYKEVWARQRNAAASRK
ncbi:hypothetical protein N9Y42_08845 [Mariniblastus sp.]|nr:hypothetical protein [Mariniblastus sp.]